MRLPASFLLAFLLAAPACSDAPSSDAQRPSVTPDWVAGATCYEVFVRSFQDSDGDGIGDLRGLRQRLDYINDGDPSTTQDLGARCVWLMPVAESPGYHGYDVSDYYRVEPDYGTNEDFRAFVRAAHQRGIRVLLDLVINHISSEHAFFQAALRDATSPYRAYFRFAPRPGPPNKWGGNNWHKSPLRDEYYYGFFWHGMPDLNYERPEALAEMKRVATYWLTEMDVDGFRLDAVKYLVEDGAIVDDVPATHQVLRQFAAHVRTVKPDAWTVGEVFDSTGALLAYYPDQLDTYFAFEVADSILAAVSHGSARGVLPPALRLQAHVPAQRWSPFLRNHDQPRTRTVLRGDMDRAAVAATIMLTMPGLPFVYYGEELGMLGDKPDEFIRTPMPWDTTGPHAGFTQGTPWQRLGPDSLVANVAAQQHNPRSLLSRHRRLIQLRDATPALARGTLIPLASTHPAIAAYVRRDGDDAVLVLANLSSGVVTDAAVSSAANALPPGRYDVRDLLQETQPDSTSPSARRFSIGPDGALRAHILMPSIPAMRAMVFHLSKRTATGP